LLLVCSCMHTLQSGALWVFPGSQKKKNSTLSGFFLGLGSLGCFYYYYFASPHSVSSSYLIVYSVVSLVYFTACVFPSVVIMSSQPTVVVLPVVVHVLCGDMLWEAHWLVVQHNNAK